MSAPEPGWRELSFVCTRDQAESISAALERRQALAVTLSDARDEPIFEPASGHTPLWRATRVSALYGGGTDLSAELDWLRAEFAGSVDGAAEGGGAAALPHHEVREIAEQDWVSAGQRGFSARRFGERLWVVPSWSTPPGGDLPCVRLDPGLAFGTGSHPTTALCLEWLDAWVRPGDSVCDYGCGSGVLAIAARALGAGEILAIDTDRQALLATGQNAAANGVDTDFEACLPGEAPPGRFDRVVANILARPLIELAADISARVAPGGRLALSGVLIEQADAVADAYRGSFESVRRSERGDWACLDLVKRV